MSVVEEWFSAPTAWGPWTIWLALLASLGATVILGLRALMAGNLVARKVHDEVRSDRDAYRKAAETALEANRELSTNVRALVDMVETLIRQQTESQLMIRRLVWSQSPDGRLEIES